VTDVAQRKRVLVVDDDPGILTLLQRRLAADYRVETVANGSQAIGAFLRERPDAVVLDMRLPGMDGEQLLPALRALSATVPIVVITGAVNAQMTDTARRHGVEHLLEKPFETHDLAARLAAVLGS
jgi:DNA-binding response OmpR family regulator